jgi:hypothetical protein
VLVDLEDGGGGMSSGYSVTDSYGWKMTTVSVVVSLDSVSVVVSLDSVVVGGCLIGMSVDLNALLKRIGMKMVGVKLVLVDLDVHVELVLVALDAHVELDS